MVIILFFIVGQDSIAQNLGKYQILIIAFISMLFYFIYLNYKDNTNLIVISILLALCFYSFYGIVKNKFINSIQDYNLLYDYKSLEDDLKKLDKHYSKNLEIDKTSEKNDLLDFIYVRHFLNKNNSNNKSIFTDIFSYTTQASLNQKIFITKSDIFRAATSKKIYFNTINKLYLATLNKEYSNNFYQPSVYKDDTNDDQQSIFNLENLYNAYFAKTTLMEWLVRYKLKRLSKYILSQTQNSSYCENNPFDYLLFSKNFGYEYENYKNIVYENNKYFVINC